jgi:hypothetical protein
VVAEVTRIWASDDVVISTNGVVGVDGTMLRPVGRLEGAAYAVGGRRVPLPRP